MNDGVAASVSAGGQAIKCDKCSGMTRVADGLCVSCFLKEGLNPDTEASSEVFEQVLAEADVPDGERRIGNYRVIKEIGRGGMGAVYLAERADEQYQRRVAIKLVKRGMDTDAVLRHFRKERQILADLDHINIARLFDGGTTSDGLPYFVMEYVEGIPIDKYCDAHNLSVNERLKLFLQVCDAVSYAHRRGIIHRDIKPSNILVTSEAVPKLVDFGIAKMLQLADGPDSLLTVTGVRPMTPEYASPEQIRGETVTKTSDVYSLGVALYELLTGSSPYRLTSRSPREVERAITEQEPTRPSAAGAHSAGNSKYGPSRTGIFRNSKLLKGDLDNIVLMALRKEPGRRYQSVEQFAEDIKRHLESRPIVARRSRAPARIWRWSQRNPVLATAVAACLFLTVAVIWLLREHVVPSQAAAPQKSIAVLPFQNLSGDPQNAYFADGVQEEILSRLSRISDLKVISRTSTQRYKSAPPNLSDIAKRLGVAHILEGSVQKAGDQVRVNVQLIHALSDSHLWADKFDRRLTDIFAVESEIATKIADTLKAQLTGAEQHAISYRPTENTAAHEFYLKARHLANSRTKAEDLLRAIDYYNQALVQDPNHAPAYAGLAEAYAILPPWTQSRDRVAIDKSKAAAKRALALDENLAEAHIAMALVYCNDFDFKGGKQELERAIALDPNNAQAHYYLGRDVFLPLGEFDRGITEIKTALELDPLSTPMSTNVGVAYMLARRYPEAIAQLRKTIQFEPNFFFAHDMLGQSLAYSGQLDEAIESWKHSYEVAKDYHSLTLIGYGYGLKGERDKALQIVGQLQELEKSGTPVWIWGYGLIHLALGEKDKAIECLQRSWQARETATPVVFIKFDPMLDPLRGDPRFEALARQIIPDSTSNNSGATVPTLNR